jgi:hypothetical protein
VETVIAEMTGVRPRIRDELQAEEEQALLAATGLIWPERQREEGDRSFEAIWHTGLVPLDAGIFALPDCATCESKTTHYPTSPQGRREILDASSFTELNRARAIGGAVCLLIVNTRNAALRSPEDTALRGLMTLIANTAFRLHLREPAKIHPARPALIVPTTLFFLHDCRWLRSAASLLAQDAVNRMPTVGGDLSILATVSHVFTETVPRALILRLSQDGVGMLLLADGLTEAVKLIQSGEMHP